MDDSILNNVFVPLTTGGAMGYFTPAIAMNGMTAITITLVAYSGSFAAAKIQTSNDLSNWSAGTNISFPGSPPATSMDSVTGVAAKYVRVALGASSKGIISISTRLSSG